MRKKYLVGAIILVLAVGYLFYLSFSSSVSYYLTVSEFFSKGTGLYDTSVRVAGKISDNPIDWNAEELELRFTITEGDENMTVVYRGAKPGGLKAGSSILVEGKYSSEGIFRANQLILKCPSKYELEE